MGGVDRKNTGNRILNKSRRCRDFYYGYSGISVGVVIIFIPIVSHFSRIVSRSIIFSAPRYNIGAIFLSSAIFVNRFIGDVICLPVANQNSSSQTQKSLSVCVAIACLSVIIMSSMTSNFFPVESR